MSSNWLADRTKLFDSSGIRKVFDLGAKLKDPINLSIGQPDFDVPESVRQAAVEAINSRKNGYALTQGVPALREKLAAQVKQQYNHDDRELFITSGTSGGLVLALLALVNPGDEVIVFDPYFALYDSLAMLVGAKMVHIDTYPDFRIDLNRVEAAITPRTKLIIFNSPANPTGAMADETVVRGLAELADRHDIVLISDEIYRAFSYEREPVSPAKFNPRTLVVDGFSKTYGMTGWRIGFAHGPAEIIREMLKLQQYTFVCAPHPLQCAAATAMDVDMSAHIADYRRKRDMLVDGIADCYEVARPGGAFYAFPKTPWGTGQEFVAEAIERHGLLIIPGNVFSRRDTHFRVSYAADDRVIQRGIEALRKLAGK
jgi:aspartate/methionine/tyrosine aminotransferase